MKTKLLAAVAVAATAAGVLAPAATAAAAPTTHATVHAAGKAAGKTAVPATLYWHDHGRSVARAQRILGLKATGTFDEHMLRTVQKFQRAHHIRPTGNVGPRTWRALLTQEKAQVTAARAGAARASAAKAAAKALGRAKAVANRNLGDVNEELAMVRGSLTGGDGVPVPLPAADSAVLLGRLSRIEAKASGLSAAVRQASTLTAVNALSRQAVALGHAVNAVEDQVSAGLVRNPDQAVAWFNAFLDELVGAAKDSGVSVDAAKETAARGVFLDGLRAFLTAAQPYADQMWAIDPLSAGGADRISALEAKIEQLPESETMGTALGDYLNQLMGAPTSPGAKGFGRGAAGAVRSRAEVLRSLPGLMRALRH